MSTEHRTIHNILLVEDDLRDVELTLAALEEHHLANKVAVVHDGAEALDYLRYRGKYQTRLPGNPVVVLLDNKMPKVSGLEVLIAIKNDEQLRTIPVVALTSSRETPDMAEFYKHGVNAYVVKPVNFTDFMKVVREVGVFWAAINEPPPHAPHQSEPSIESGEVIVSGKEEEKNEISAPHPAP